MCMNVQEQFTGDWKKAWASKWECESKTSAVAAIGDLRLFR